MCIVLLRLDHPDFALILASNRDEFLARPTAASHWHHFSAPDTFESPQSAGTGRSLTPSLAQSKDGCVGANGAVPDGPAAHASPQRPILSGIDVHPNGGGTWIGVSRTGRFATLTNFTEAAPPPLPTDRGLSAYRSRGKLAKDWLLQDCNDAHGGTQERRRKALDDYLSGLHSRSDEYPGFNFMAGQLFADKEGRGEMRIGYVTNRGQADEVYYLPEQHSEGTVALSCPELGSDDKNATGCSSLGLSNSVLQEPWHKVRRGRRLFDGAVHTYDKKRAGVEKDEQSRAELASDLFAVLATEAEENVQVADLPHRILVQPLRRDEMSGWYATRTSTVLLVRRNAEPHTGGFAMQWWERDVHVIDDTNSPHRCEALTHQRHYQSVIVPPKHV